MSKPHGQNLAGALYIVATPIGHLRDITLRAIDTLKKVDIIAAEDTRHTHKLLSHYDIQSNLISCHEHNESYRIPALIEKIKSGMSVALVSDAGTPSVSDPGYRLVNAAIAEGLPVIPIPGPSAAISALCASGLPSDSFYFAGFLPATPSKRRTKLEEISKIHSTLIFYESPRRIESTLKDMLHVLGDRPGVLARELTKIHEEFLRGNLSELIAAMQGVEPMKGEITLLISPAAVDNFVEEDKLVSRIESELEKGQSSPSLLAKEVAKIFKMPKNIIYQKILEIKSAMDNSGKGGQ